MILFDIRQQLSNICGRKNTNHIEYTFTLTTPAVI